MATSIAPWVRILILVVATSVAAIIAKTYTGDYLPTAPREAVLFQNALLLIVLGSALSWSATILSRPILS